MVPFQEYIVAESVFDDHCSGCGNANLEQPDPAEPNRYFCPSCGLKWLVMSDADAEAFNRTLMDEESNLVKHARKELSLINEEPDIVTMYMRIVEAFSSYGHSGGSAAACIDVINKLLRFQPLTPLTNDPNEWMEVSEAFGGDDGMWQSLRDSEAFSDDGGQSYWLLRDGASSRNRFPRYTSLNAKK